MALTIKVELDEVTKTILSIKDATTDKELATPTNEELVVARQAKELLEGS